MEILNRYRVQIIFEQEIMAATDFLAEALVETMMRHKQLSPRFIVTDLTHETQDQHEAYSLHPMNESETDHKGHRIPLVPTTLVNPD